MSSHYQSSHHGGSHYLSSHYGRIGVPTPVPPFTPDDVPHPPGTGRRRQIMEEDEAIMAIIIAFLESKD